MSAEIIPIGRACRMLRGAEVEAKREATLKLRRRAAYEHAIYGCYNKADLAAFGPMDKVLAEGRDPEAPRFGPGARRA